MLLSHLMYQNLRRFSTRTYGKDHGEDILQDTLLYLIQKGKLETATKSYVLHAIKLKANHFFNRGKSIDSLKRKDRMVSLHDHVFQDNKKLLVYETIQDYAVHTNGLTQEKKGEQLELELF